MSDSGFRKLIETAVEGDYVNLKTICLTLDIKLVIDKKLKDLCKVGVDEEQRATIWLNSDLDKKTKMTMVAIAVAEYIIHPERVLSSGVVYDVFFLRELTTNKSTKLIMLATRLAVPEHIIEKIVLENEVNFLKTKDYDKFDIDNYIANSSYLPEFIRCVIKESTGIFLLDNLTVR